MNKIKVAIATVVTAEMVVVAYAYIIIRLLRLTQVIINNIQNVV